MTSKEVEKNYKIIHIYSVVHICIRLRNVTRKKNRNFSMRKKMFYLRFSSLNQFLNTNSCNKVVWKSFSNNVFSSFSLLLSSRFRFDFFSSTHHQRYEKSVHIFKAQLVIYQQHHKLYNQLEYYVMKTICTIFLPFALQVQFV